MPCIIKFNPHSHFIGYSLLLFPLYKKGKWSTGRLTSLWTHSKWPSWNLNQSYHYAYLLCHTIESIRRRQRHPTPVLLPGKSHRRRSLVGCSPWDREKSDTTEQLDSLLTFMHWRRKWQPTPVFLPGESQGWGSLVGCRLWGRTESDTTEVT